jgi:PGF-CTERM protein
VTATKAPAAPPTATATDAPPGDKTTPAPAKKPAAAKAAAPAADGTTAGDAQGFTAVFAIAGMLAVAYAMMRRREQAAVQAMVDEGSEPFTTFLFFGDNVSDPFNVSMNGV